MVERLGVVVALAEIAELGQGDVGVIVDGMVSAPVRWALRQPSLLGIIAWTLMSTGCQRRAHVGRRPWPSAVPAGAARREAPCGAPPAREVLALHEAVRLGGAVVTAAVVAELVQVGVVGVAVNELERALVDREHAQPGPL